MKLLITLIPFHIKLEKKNGTNSQVKNATGRRALAQQRKSCLWGSGWMDATGCSSWCSTGGVEWWSWVEVSSVEGSGVVPALLHDI